MEGEGREIKCRRELRQGDPLSSLIFTFVAKGLRANKSQKEPTLSKDYQHPNIHWLLTFSMLLTPFSLDKRTLVRQ